MTLFNTHTQEFGTIKYKNGSNYLTDGLVSLNHILRCRMTDAEIGMSLKLVELIDEIEDHFGTRVEIISGYRSPALNSTLRNSGHRVAQNSLHMEGMAVDIRMPGVPLREIRDYAGRLKAGGVGYYPGQFVHVDVGEVRYW
ncbi:MAG: hypothetical protein A3I09_02710 [Deltaproteobacteria bacterium RIFCSPLOWO2_02_FULL_47_10]|nr:MAG: hypothetical protein A3I09_02710 [Deltaproteobacteria bacterium RIFCSPLOWO2_02_FULL_47_10]